MKWQKYMKLMNFIRKNAYVLKAKLLYSLTIAQESKAQKPNISIQEKKKIYFMQNIVTEESNALCPPNREVENQTKNNISHLLKSLSLCLTFFHFLPVIVWQTHC